MSRLYAETSEFMRQLAAAREKAGLKCNNHNATFSPDRWKKSHHVGEAFRGSVRGGKVGWGIVR